MRSDNSTTDQIKSYLRLKPGCDKTLYINNEDTLTVTRTGESFQYDKVFDQNTKNIDVFATIQPFVQHCLSGYNSCIMAYGQTASGKTHTMKGQPKQEGLIGLIVQSLFKRIHQKKTKAEIRISYIQIYNQNIVDLLRQNPQPNLQIRQLTKKTLLIMNLTEQAIRNAQQAVNLFQNGEMRRKFSPTLANHQSSRSHTIFRIHLEVVQENWQKTLSMLNLVDLAGSQGVSRTKAEGAVKKQGDNINKSLLALSNVMRAMSEKTDYINFRDSKLTRILQSSLCTNSRSAIICTLNITHQNMAQCINTLKFGVCARKISLAVKKGIVSSLNNQIVPFTPSPKIQSIYDISFNETVMSLEAKIIEYFDEIKKLEANLKRISKENEKLKAEIVKRDFKIISLQNQNQRLIALVATEKQWGRGFERIHQTAEDQLIRQKKNSQFLRNQLNRLHERRKDQLERQRKAQETERFLMDKVHTYQRQIKELKANNQQLKQKKIDKQSHYLGSNNNTLNFSGSLATPVAYSGYINPYRRQLNKKIQKAESQHNPTLTPKINDSMQSLHFKTQSYNNNSQANYYDLQIKQVQQQKQIQKIKQLERRQEFQRQKQIKQRRKFEQQQQIKQDEQQNIDLDKSEHNGLPPSCQLVNRIQHLKKQLNNTLRHLVDIGEQKNRKDAYIIDLQSKLNIQSYYDELVQQILPSQPPKSKTPTIKKDYPGRPPPQPTPKEVISDLRKKINTLTKQAQNLRDREKKLLKTISIHLNKDYSDLLVSVSSQTQRQYTFNFDQKQLQQSNNNNNNLYNQGKKPQQGLYNQFRQNKNNVYQLNFSHKISQQQENRFETDESLLLGSQQLVHQSSELYFGQSMINLNQKQTFSGNKSDIINQCNINSNKLQQQCYFKQKQQQQSQINYFYENNGFIQNECQINNSLGNQLRQQADLQKYNCIYDDNLIQNVFQHNISQNKLEMSEMNTDQQYSIFEKNNKSREETSSDQNI